MATESLSSTIQVSLMFALFLLMVSLVIGLIRAWKGPSIEDRFSSLLLISSTGVAIMFILGLILQLPALYDSALVLALLAAVISIALTRLESHHD
ncbi:MAG: monovalent cation/H+ antiporter complex subunit F [Gammaproteobacteria bacterium]|nr:monovalent cation/H+ antiporter complex subunit F [Gammaproteobacteria bacterium]